MTYLVVDDGYLGVAGHLHGGGVGYEVAEVDAALELAVAGEGPEDGEHQRLGHVLLDDLLGEREVLLLVVGEHVADTLVEHGEHGTEGSANGIEGTLGCWPKAKNLQSFKAKLPSRICFNENVRKI